MTGVRCPACQSEHIWVHGARVLPDGGLAWDFRCLNCQTAFDWRDVRCRRWVPPRPAMMVAALIGWPVAALGEVA